MHNTLGHPLIKQHLKKLVQMGAGKSVTEKWQKTGTDK